MLLLVIFSNPVVSEEITDESFNGKWCGKWDNMYSVCITIDSVESGDTAKYQWLEHPNGKFNKDNRKIERINLNTIKLENIWFVLNEQDLAKADAFGTFRIQTRIAELSKQVSNDSSKAKSPQN